MTLTPLDRTALRSLAVFRDYDTDTDGRPTVIEKTHACDCGHEWTDWWSCGCDDECPECGTAVGAEEFGVDTDLPAWARELWKLLPEVETEARAAYHATAIRTVANAPGLAELTGRRARATIATLRGHGPSDWRALQSDPDRMVAITREIAAALIAANTGAEAA